MALPIPFINGVRYDPSSYEIKIDGIICRGVKSITYEDGLAPVDVFAAGNPAPIARTRGVYSRSASMELYLDEANDLLYRLQTKIGGTGDGYGEVAFDVSVLIYEPPRPALRHVLIGCRLTKVGDEMPGSGGADTSSQKYDLNPMWIERNGKKLFRVPGQ